MYAFYERLFGNRSEGTTWTEVEQKREHFISHLEWLTHDNGLRILETYILRCSDMMMVWSCTTLLPGMSFCVVRFFNTLTLLFSPFSCWLTSAQEQAAISGKYKRKSMEYMMMSFSNNILLFSWNDYDRQCYSHYYYYYHHSSPLSFCIFPLHPTALVLCILLCGSGKGGKFSKSVFHSSYVLLLNMTTHDRDDNDRKGDIIQWIPFSRERQPFQGFLRVRRWPV